MVAIEENKECDEFDSSERDSQPGKQTDRPMGLVMRIGGPDQMVHSLTKLKQNANLYEMHEMLGRSGEMKVLFKIKTQKIRVPFIQNFRCVLQTLLPF